MHSNESEWIDANRCRWSVHEQRSNVDARQQVSIECPRTTDVDARQQMSIECARTTDVTQMSMRDRRVSERRERMHRCKRRTHVDETHKRRRHHACTHTSWRSTIATGRRHTARSDGSGPSAPTCSAAIAANSATVPTRRSQPPAPPWPSRCANAMATPR
jgi:hypothetical protein